MNRIARLVACSLLLSACVNAPDNPAKASEEQAPSSVIVYDVTNEGTGAAMFGTVVDERLYQEMYISFLEDQNLTLDQSITAKVQVLDPWGVDLGIAGGVMFTGTAPPKAGATYAMSIGSVPVPALGKLRAEIQSDVFIPQLTITAY
jgi:hypothetical protein